MIIIMIMLHRKTTSFTTFQSFLHRTKAGLKYPGCLLPPLSLLYESKREIALLLGNIISFQLVISSLHFYTTFYIIHFMDLCESIIIITIIATAEKHGWIRQEYKELAVRNKERRGRRRHVKEKLEHRQKLRTTLLLL